MASGRFRFEQFLLDAGDRQLRRDGEAVELNTRYLDALTLLVREHGKLVSKSRFLEEVWRGVPVTDEALTQCIKTLRRQLGDSAARPRFIETVPKHGYRFVAPVETVAADPERGTGVEPPSHGRRPDRWRDFLQLGGAGTVGGGMAGLIGGMIYGFVAATQALQPGLGGLSVLLVLVCLSIVVALLGGAGVGFGIATASLLSPRFWRWSVPGAAAGGLVVGAVVNLLGVDMFNLLFGQSPGRITGAAEGAVLGAGVGLGSWLASRSQEVLPIRRGVAVAALTGGVAGSLIAAFGGRLMGGSLDLLSERFPDSRLRLDPVGALFGERGFGPLSQVATAALEGALFGGCMVGAMFIMHRRLRKPGV